MENEFADSSLRHPSTPSIPSFPTHSLRVHIRVYISNRCCSFQYHAAHAEELMPPAKRILPPALKLDYALLVARLTRLISRERRIAANIQKSQKRFPIVRGSLTGAHTLARLCLFYYVFTDAFVIFRAIEWRDIHTGFKKYWPIL